MVSEQRETEQEASLPPYRPVEGRAENYANGNRANGSRKPLMLIISVGFASVVVAGVIVAGAAVLNYKPVQQHVEVEITRPNK